MKCLRLSVNALLRAGNRQNGFVTQRLTGLTDIAQSQHLMPQTTQLFHHRQREILVGQQSRHRSIGLVLADLLLDLVAMHAEVSPGIH